MVTAGSSVYVFQEFDAVVLGDALHYDFCVGVLAHESTIGQSIASRPPNKAFVLRLVLETSSVRKVFDEGHTPVSAVGYWWGALDGADKLFLAILLLDQVIPDAWFDKILDRNFMGDLSPG